jgi:hypothetical protein
MSPDSIKNLGFIHLLSSSPSGVIGGFLGIFVASYFSFTPSIMSIPNKIREFHTH